MPAGSVTVADDCDDTSASVSPAAAEVCGNGRDEDCDGADDSCATYAYDGDGITDDPTSAAVEADGLMVGMSASTRFGYSLVVGADLDGDGVPSVLVSEYQRAITVSTVVHYGVIYAREGFLTSTSTADTAAEIRIYGDSGTFPDTVGAQISNLGDFDGDGKDELAVRTEYYTYTTYVYEGESLSGTIPYDGSAVFDILPDVGGPGTSIGDASSPTGNDDVAFGTPSAGSTAGGVGIYTYSSGGLVLAGSLTGEVAGDNAGWSVGGGPDNDVDGDGYDDLFVGAPENEGAGTNAGAAYVVLSPVTSTMSLAAADLKIEGTAGDQFGFSTRAIGDVNGDGRPDLLATAPYDDQDGASSGSVAIYEDVDPMGVDPDTSAEDFEVVVIGDAASGWLGLATPAFGDANGDGELDLLVGHYRYLDGSGARVGAAMLVYGPLAGTYDLDDPTDYGGRFLGEEELDDCGYTVGMADLDLDGLDDLLVSCMYGDGSGKTDYGTLAWWYGG